MRQERNGNEESEPKNPKREEVRGKEREKGKKKARGIMIVGKTDPWITHDEHLWGNYRAPNDHQHTNASNTHSHSVHYTLWLLPRVKKEEVKEEEKDRGVYGRRMNT